MVKPDAKRIVLFVPSFEKGGVERNAVFFANAMVELCFDLTLLYCRKQDGWFDRLDSKVELLKVGGDFRIPGVHERITDAVKMLFFAPLALQKMKRKQRLALVGFQSNVVAIFLARLLFLPVAVRLSNHYSSIPNEKSLLRKISELGKILFYRWADIVVANSSELAKDYAKFLGREVITIHNPIDFNLIEKLRIDIIPEQLFQNKKRPIVIGAGRLSKQKNFKLLIEAIAKVEKEVPCDLVIIGEGAERQRLEALVRKLSLDDYVHLIGHRDNPYKYFSSSDLFVLSSSYEGMPNVLIEAIASGLPVVSTRCQSGPNEILDYGSGGLMCNCNDANDLARNILFALTNKDRVNEMRIHAKNGVRRYEISKITDKYQDMVEKVFYFGKVN
jgi:glycosyltransferase involved in cell wall biosynthesis